jgi:hypothetical protein
VRLPALILGALLITGCVAPPTVDLTATNDRVPTGLDAELDPCSEINITTVIAKRLRVGVIEPFQEPYLFNAGPLGVQGYQADVIYAIAGEFGLRPNAVVWLEVPPEANPIDVEADFLLTRAGERPDLASSPVYGPDASILAFAPGNPFLGCVTAAVEELSAAGRFAEIERDWLPTGG